MERQLPNGGLPNQWKHITTDDSTVYAHPIGYEVHVSPDKFDDRLIRVELTATADAPEYDEQTTIERWGSLPSDAVPIVALGFMQSKDIFVRRDTDHNPEFKGLKLPSETLPTMWTHRDTSSGTAFYAHPSGYEIRIASHKKHCVSLEATADAPEHDGRAVIEKRDAVGHSMIPIIALGYMQGKNILVENQNPT